MSKVVFNNRFGGFSLSKEAVLLARKLSNNPRWGNICLGGELYNDGSGVADSIYDNGKYIDENVISRHNPILIKVVEMLGKKANGICANLQIFKFEGVVYWIEDYDGYETVHTPNDQEWVIIEERRE